MTRILGLLGIVLFLPFHSIAQELGPEELVRKVTEG